MNNFRFRNNEKVFFLQNGLLTKLFSYNQIKEKEGLTESFIRLSVRLNGTKVRKQSSQKFYIAYLHKRSWNLFTSTYLISLTDVNWHLVIQTYTTSGYHDNSIPFRKISHWDIIAWKWLMVRKETIIDKLDILINKVRWRSGHPKPF